MIKEKISEDLKAAMKAGEAAKVSTLRMAIAAIRNKEIEKRTESLSDDDALQVLSTEARKRKESVLSFESAGRTELAEKEKAELEVLKGYLPADASQDEIRKIVKETIAKLGAAGPKEMGKVMGASMSELKGRADGSQVQAIVKEELGAM